MSRKRARASSPSASTPRKRQRGSTVIQKSKQEGGLGDIEDLAPGWNDHQEIQSVRSQLLAWYDEKEERSMPWRMDPTSWKQAQEEAGDGATLEQLLTQRAYEVWVSEVMLQQTRVATVIDYFQRWMKKFPSITVLAAASLEQVNELWAGLGYYRRAKLLHQGAMQVVQEHGGIIPHTAKELLELPGIGRYTAGAIASIVFEESTPAVDGNVIRVLSRLRAISDNPQQASTQKLIWRLTQEVVDRDRPGCFNQALMDLGASLCAVKTPQCSSCPLESLCHARQQEKEGQGKVTDFPVKVKKAAPRPESVLVCLVSRVIRTEESEERQFLLVQRPSTGLLASMWEFPSVVLASDETLQPTQKQERMVEFLTQELACLSKNVEFPPDAFREIGETSHEFSHIKQTLIVTSGELPPDTTLTPDANQPVKWEPSDRLQTLAVSKGMKKCFDLMERHKQPPKGKRNRQPKLNQFFTDSSSNKLQ